MKTSFLPPAFFVATLFLGLSLRAADPDLPPSTSIDDGTVPSGLASRQANRRARYDKNGDGRLDPAEKSAARAAAQELNFRRRTKVYERMLTRYDKDRDGQVQSGERAAALAAIKLRPGFIQRFDQDGDGILSPTEEAIADGVIGDRMSRPNYKSVSRRNAK